MIIDQTGTLANVKRHDYLPFGEELFAGVGGRTTALGYTGGDAVRQQFTEKERDVETGLDYFLARYYSSTQGRFTSPDEFSGGPDELFDFVDDASINPTFYADLLKPQSLNKYQYSYNNPLRYVDPDGHDPAEPNPPQDPRPVLPVPAPIPGAPPVLIPSTTTSTSKVPNDATIIEGAKSVLDTIADYTGITWVAEKLRPIIWPSPAPAPTTETPPTQNQQPLPPPAPIEAKKTEVKTATRTPGGVTSGETVSDKQAAGRLKSGRDTVSPSRAKARQVAKKASPDGKVVHHKPHGPGYRPHYHDKKHKNGHSFY
ncbi:MAG TPA: RHS repeat-associated core domain-containing protein [Pyrinomonadaceae bacterium]|nr:RHS repeat-associated core domain-containing protein [Pyrinomonadaceae bacterium]